MIHNIGPYEGVEFAQAVKRLEENKFFLENFPRFIAKKSSDNIKEDLVCRLKSVNTIDDFQRNITSDLFISQIIEDSIDEYTFEGVSELENRSYVFVSNHRDIILDAALLCYALYKCDKNICEMVVGENLLIDRLATDLFKLNGAITAKRNFSSTSELREETTKLSEYMTNSIEMNGKSLWIAQKSGRNKDGIDNTSPAILKMLYVSLKEKGVSFNSFLNRIPIVPVSISYQFDPCVLTKSYQLLGIKTKYSDLVDMIRGLRHYKGKVHIKVGTPLKGVFDNPRDATSEMDKQVHLNYKLFDTNYFAWDYLHGSGQFRSEYRDLDTEDFLRKYKSFDKKIREYVFNQYANPVESFLKDSV